jgi:signal transduction histidine kinase
MSLDRRDLEMLTVSIPVVDYWEMREELDRLNDSVDRLERITEALIELYRVERVKNWELILQEMLKQQKGNRNGSRFK